MGRQAVKTCVITGYGINADMELEQAFSLAGSEAYRVHIQDLINNPQLLQTYNIIAFAGGFSFGDHLGSGKVFATLFKKHLKQDMQKFIDRGGLVLGICNGFQELVKTGMLPNLEGDWQQEVSLIHNNSGRFEDRWVCLQVNKNSPCVWTDGIEELEAPVRHGEGKFVTASDKILQTIIEKQLIVFKYIAKSGGVVKYPDNPNGSINNIAGICDKSGHILGLMPHPEAFIIPENHPRWTREKIEYGWGLCIFENGVKFVKNNS
jgi:phosphoribosylformylglycinamidine synthase I